MKILAHYLSKVNVSVIKGFGFNNSNLDYLSTNLFLIGRLTLVATDYIKSSAAIFDNMDGCQDYYTKRNKSEKVDNHVI